MIQFGWNDKLSHYNFIELYICSYLFLNILVGLFGFIELEHAM